MARTATVAKKAATKSTGKSSTPSIEAKALKAETKSEGMRLLMQNGYTVSQTAKVFDAPYGFVYGVAQRAGLAETAANRKSVKAEPKAKAAAKPSKASSKAAAAKAKALIKPKAPKAAKRYTPDTGTAQRKAEDVGAKKAARALAKAKAEAAATKPQSAKARATSTPPTPKVTKVAGATTPKVNGAAKTSAVDRVAAKLNKQAGRPTAERRQLNRKAKASEAVATQA
jgi:hypothetical protein